MHLQELQELFRQLKAARLTIHCPPLWCTCMFFFFFFLCTLLTIAGLFVRKIHLGSYGYMDACMCFMHIENG